MVLADSFTASPAGYVIATLITVLIVATGYAWRRADQRADVMENALATISRGLAVVVEQVGGTSRLTKETATVTSKLQVAVAVLESRLNRHEEWARAESERLHRID